MPGDRSRIWKIPGPGAVAAVAWILLLLIPPSAHAHRVYVFAWMEGGEVHTESYLGGKKRAAGGTIQVFDLAGNRLVQGKTDDNGNFSFPDPGKGDLRILFDAGMGHRAEYLLKVSEEGSTVDSPAKAQREPAAAAKALPVPISRTELRNVVEEVLDTRLAPITRELARIRKEEAPGFREITAGIGYILGIMGIVLYFRSRKKPPQDRR